MRSERIGKLMRANGLRVQTHGLKVQTHDDGYAAFFDCGAADYGPSADELNTDYRVSAPMK